MNQPNQIKLQPCKRLAIEPTDSPSVKSMVRLHSQLKYKERWLALLIRRKAKPESIERLENKIDELNARFISLS
jgi:hypothetical protein